MIYLASYTGTHASWQGWVNRGIRWLDRAAHSHSEVCHGNPFEGPVLCHSSTGVDGGVRCKTMQLSPDKWDLLPVPWVTHEAAKAVFDAARGKPYDYLGVGRFALPFMLREHPTRYFCSEYAGCVLGMPQPWRNSPAGLHMATLARVATLAAQDPSQFTPADLALIEQQARKHGQPGQWLGTE